MLNNKESCKIDLCLISTPEIFERVYNKESCKIDLRLIYRRTESLQRISSYTSLKIPSLLDSPVWRVHIDCRIFSLDLSVTDPCLFFIIQKQNSVINPLSFVVKLVRFIERSTKAVNKHPLVDSKQEFVRVFNLKKISRKVFSTNSLTSSVYLIIFTTLRAYPCISRSNSFKVCSK